MKWSCTSLAALQYFTCLIWRVIFWLGWSGEEGRTQTQSQSHGYSHDFTKHTHCIPESQTYCFLKVLIFSWRVHSHKHFHSVVICDCLLLFSHSIQSDSLWPHGLQHVSLPCPTLSPRVCSNSCPLSQWYCPTTSSSIALLSSCPQTFPASGSFPVSWLFASGGQMIEASALVSVLPMNM